VEPWVGAFHGRLRHVRGRMSCRAGIGGLWGRAGAREPITRARQRQRLALAWLREPVADEWVQLRDEPRENRLEERPVEVGTSVPRVSVHSDTERHKEMLQSEDMAARLKMEVPTKAASGSTKEGLW